MNPNLGLAFQQSGPDLSFLNDLSIIATSKKITTFLFCKTCFDVTHIFVSYKEYLKNCLNL